MCQISQNKKAQTSTGHLCIKKDHEPWDQLIRAAEMSKTGLQKQTQPLSIWSVQELRRQMVQSKSRHPKKKWGRKKLCHRWRDIRAGPTSAFQTQMDLFSQKQHCWMQLPRFQGQLVCPRWCWVLTSPRRPELCTAVPGKCWHQPQSPTGWSEIVHCLGCLFSTATSHREVVVYSVHCIALTLKQHDWGAEMLLTTGQRNSITLKILSSRFIQYF